MEDLFAAVSNIRSGHTFAVDENNQLIWQDDEALKPTEKEIQESFGQLKNLKIEKLQQRKNLLNKLGITEDEAKLLLG